MLNGNFLVMKEYVNSNSCRTAPPPVILLTTSTPSCLHLSKFTSSSMLWKYPTETQGGDQPYSLRIGSVPSIKLFNSTSSRAIFHGPGLNPVSRSLIFLTFKLRMVLLFASFYLFPVVLLSCSGFKHPKIASVREYGSKPNASTCSNAFSIVSLRVYLSNFVSIREDSS